MRLHPLAFVCAPYKAFHSSRPALNARVLACLFACSMHCYALHNFKAIHAGIALEIKMCAAIKMKIKSEIECWRKLWIRILLDGERTNERTSEQTKGRKASIER